MRDRMRLSEIAHVQTGLVLSRKEARADSDSSVKYSKLSLRSINDDGSINKGFLEPYFAVETLEEQFVTAVDDLVIRLSPPFCPTLIGEEFMGLVVPSQFAVVRLRRDDMLPGFLWCYLSHGPLLEALVIREKGQAWSGIKVSALSEMRIPMLTVKKQKAVVTYSEMNAKCKKMYADLIQQYDRKMDAVMSEATGGRQYGDYKKRN